MHWPERDPLPLLGWPPSLREARLPVQDRPPVKVLPCTSWTEVDVGPLLLWTVIPPVTLVPTIWTPPVLLLTVSPPLKLLPAQEELAPSTTGPVVPVIVLWPLVLAPQKVIAAAPLELRPPVILPPVTASTPPEVTVTPPVALPPLAIRTAWPFPTVSPLWLPVMVWV